jgi:arabinofuranosyltransferase
MTGKPDVAEGPSSALLVKTVLLALFGVVVIKTAWLSDDALITMRTVDNVVSGYGPRWNVAERVQAYTHPLWMLLLAIPYSVTREAFFTTLSVSIGLSLLAVWIVLFRVAASWRTAVVGGIVFMCSKAFVDYSTSGLENPLSHVLMAIFLWAYWKERRLIELWGLAGLIMLSRLDLALLVLPALVVRSLEHDRRTALRATAVGLVPIVAWEIFSLVYYGSLVPNTAYAKLQTGAATGALLAQGFVYLLDSVGSDPTTLLAIVAFASAAVITDPRRHWPIALGIVLYLAYIVRIGGDFMSGRFMSVLVLCAVAMFVHIRWRLPASVLPVLSIVLLIPGVFATTRAPLTSAFRTFPSDPELAVEVSGISDERAVYFREAGLLRWTRDAPLPLTQGAKHGLAARAAGGVIVSGQVGYFGYHAGPGVHVVDEFGLGDPLLARLPAKPGWRIGHYLREVPEGYVETLERDRNMIRDPNIARLYEQVRTVTRAPLWSRRRWRAIVDLNLGRQ